jgi:D-proline reductase (dithiol) PrdB
MDKLKRLKNQTLAKVYTKIPSLLDLYAKGAELVINTTTPFTPLSRPLDHSRVALVTTGGIHTKDQKPFDMSDKNGDPSYRMIPSNIGMAQLRITHDYYNHKDALADPNLVVPIEPLERLLHQGHIGSIGPRVVSFMGHIMGEHLQTLIQVSAPEVALALKDDEVDAVFLTPT